MHIFGIDEAGRGAVLGPMVMCGVVISKENIEKLRQLNIKDSKELNKKERKKLVPKIEELIDDKIIFEVSAKTIDQERKQISLNDIEYNRIAEMLNALKPDKAIIDATEVDTVKIKNILISKLDKDLKEEIDLQPENYADSNHKVVGAASILAKVRRDESIEKIERKIGEEIGIGYPSDTKTREFIRRTVKKDGELPDFIRKSWITTQKIINEHNQNDLSGYCDETSKNI